MREVVDRALGGGGAAAPGMLEGGGAFRFQNPVPPAEIIAASPERLLTLEAYDCQRKMRDLDTKVEAASADWSEKAAVDDVHYTLQGYREAKQERDDYVAECNERFQDGRSITLATFGAVVYPQFDFATAIKEAPDNRLTHDARRFKADMLVWTFRRPGVVRAASVQGLEKDAECNRHFNSTGDPWHT
jgi:hypothetical protein